MKKLYVMCGVPGCGKSTWIENHVQDNELIISRDNIRYSLLKTGEPYFAHEPEVFKIFCKSIVEGLQNYDVVYADATHINKKSRNKLMNGLLINDFHADDVEKIVVYFKIPVIECLNRNANREGRAKVNNQAILDMAHNFQPPTEAEYFDKIIIVGENDE